MGYSEGFRRPPIAAFVLLNLPVLKRYKRPYRAYTMSNQFPEVFIGSSSEGERVARAIELHLHRHANVTIWMNGVFTPGVSFLQSLLNALGRFDFAVLILTPDDLLEKRDASYSSPRDNVIFELGLFMGRLGARRAFFVAEEDRKLTLPSDLDGISRLNYRRRDDIAAAVSPASTVLIDEIRKQGPLERAKQSTDSPNPRLVLSEPLSEAENELRLLARDFFRADYDGRQKSANRVTRLATEVPLDRVLLMSDSALPGERVAAGIALTSHVRKDPAIASYDAVHRAIERGLDDSRSRVRYRFVELVDQLPGLILRFRSKLQVLLREESNEAVRLRVESTLSHS